MISAGSIADNDFFKEEAVLTRVVFEGLQAVLGDVDKLQAYIARFDVSASRTNSSSAEGAGEKLCTLEYSPPTGTIADLVVLQSLQPFPAQQFASITKKDEFPNLKKQYLQKMMPIKELVAAAKKRLTSVSERKKAQKSVDNGGKFNKLAGQSVPVLNLKGLDECEKMQAVSFGYSHIHKLSQAPHLRLLMLSAVC